MKVGYLITARLKSTRLPKKLLREIHGREIIAHMLDRLKLARRVDEIILCTSPGEEDRPLFDLAEREGVRAFAGDPEDVLARLSGACEAFDLDYALNITGDCPFADPGYADRIVEAYRDTNADLIRSFGLPHGAFSYGLRPEALKAILDLKLSDSTEVWGRYFTDLDCFDVHDLPIENPLHRRPGLRMTLDYPEDLAFFQAVFDRLHRPGEVFSLDEILQLLREHPEIEQINAGCSRAFLKRWTAQSEIHVKPRHEVRSAAVIGCGSIGQRHIRNLRSLGLTDITALRTRRGHTQQIDPDLGVREVTEWDELLAAAPDVAIVSNPTSLHVETTRRLLPHVRGVFVEKPLAARPGEDLSALLGEADAHGRTVFVGYNLRYHPVTRAVLAELAEGRVGWPVCLQCQVGQYLPDWHPDEDYRQAYFAREDLGGGVTRTLSHEIDLAAALLGPIERVHGWAGGSEELGIDVDAVSDMLLGHRDGPVSQVHLDYAQRVPSRTGVLVCTDGWIRYDMIAPYVQARTRDEPAPRELLDGPVDPNRAYVDMMDEFLRFVREGRCRHRLDHHHGALVVDVADMVLRGEAERPPAVVRPGSGIFR